VKCFYFTSHLRDEWRGNTPTGKREPKGKETLLELASLYLWLERLPGEDGKVPDAPSAIVLKQRLADTFIDPETGEVRITALMPPRIPVATVQAIRRYITCPPDYTKLKDGERVIEKPATEEELLRLRVAAAEAERDTEQSRLTRLSRAAELQAMAARSAAGKPQAADQTAKVQEAKQEARKEEAAEAKREEAAAKVVDAAQEEVDRVAAEAKAKMDAVKEQEKKLLQDAPPEMRLNDEQKRLKEEGAVEIGSATANRSPDLCTRSQIEEVKRLVGSLKINNDKLKDILSRAKVTKVAEMTREHCHRLIEKMLAKEREHNQGK
jgi:chemotaxis protein histidine kinase CheA